MSRILYEGDREGSPDRVQCRERARSGVLRLVLGLCVVFATGCAHRTYKTQAPAPVPQTYPAPGGPASSPPSGPPPATERQPATPGVYVEEGVASWYGVPFNGHRTSNGEIYDMHEMTAAHRTLPFGAMVRVTNLSNGKQTEVRVNDRGPFVANRVIDLSMAAAQAIEMVGTGTARVRLEIIGGPDPLAGFFGVQVGAFAAPENAERLRARLTERYSHVTAVPVRLRTGQFYRVRVGRLPNEADARALAEQIHSSEQFVTFVVRLDK